MCDGCLNYFGRWACVLGVQIAIQIFPCPVAVDLYLLQNYQIITTSVAPIADAVQNGWSLDAATRMLTVKKLKAQTNQKLDASKLQRLTECVFHLEH